MGVSFSCRGFCVIFPTSNSDYKQIFFVKFIDKKCYAKNLDCFSELSSI